MSPRTGRPPKGEISRNVSLQVRLSSEEAELIKECADKLSTSRTDVIVRGVKLVAKEISAKK